MCIRDSSEGYDQRHITKAEWQASGTEGTYESYRDAMADMTKQFEESALLKTTAQPGMFILKKKSDSKMSPAFQSSVNFAQMCIRDRYWYVQSNGRVGCYWDRKDGSSVGVRPVLAF